MTAILLRKIQKVNWANDNNLMVHINDNNGNNATAALAPSTSSFLPRGGKPSNDVHYI